MLDLINREHQNPDGKNSQKAMKWILLDRLIIGLIAFCAVMPAEVPSVNEFWVMVKAFLAAFVLQLAVERGLKKK